MRPFLLFSLLILLFAPAPHAEEVAIGHDITVLADTSLTVPLSLIVRQYVRDTSVPVTTAFSTTKEQVENIRQGGEADLFISAKPAWIGMLQQEGLIDVYSRTSIARNQLELIGARPADGPLSAENLEAFFKRQDEDFRFILGDPEYLAEGTYGLEALRKMHLTRELEPHLTLMDNVADIKRSVAEYDAFSLVFRSDALLDTIAVPLFTIPEESHPPITYEAVVVVGDNMEGARAFLKYLQSDKARTTFREYGFLDAR